MSDERAHLFIRGRVQGVCYRLYARARAKELDLTGWVRNLPSGQVELVAEGPDDRLQALVAWCRQGPDYARVTRVDETREPPRSEFTDFEITY